MNLHNFHMITHCPFCDSDNLSEKTTTEHGVDRDNNAWICPGYEYTECLNCHEEFVTSAQARANDVRIVRTPR